MDNGNWSARTTLMTLMTLTISDWWLFTIDSPWKQVIFARTIEGRVLVTCPSTRNSQWHVTCARRAERGARVYRQIPVYPGATCQYIISYSPHIRGATCQYIIGVYYNAREARRGSCRWTPSHLHKSRHSHEGLIGMTQFAPQPRVVVAVFQCICIRARAECIRRAPQPRGPDRFDTVRATATGSDKPQRRRR